MRIWFINYLKTHISDLGPCFHCVEVAPLLSDSTSLIQGKSLVFKHVKRQRNMVGDVFANISMEPHYINVRSCNARG